MPVARCYTYSWNQDSFGERPAGVPLVSTPPKHPGLSSSAVGLPHTHPRPPSHLSRAEGRALSSGLALTLSPPVSFCLSLSTLPGLCRRGSRA